MKGKAKSKAKSEKRSGGETPRSEEVAKTGFRLAFAILRGES